MAGTRVATATPEVVKRRAEMRAAVERFDTATREHYDWVVRTRRALFAHIPQAKNPSYPSSLLAAYNEALTALLAMPAAAALGDRGEWIGYFTALKNELGELGQLQGEELDSVNRDWAAILELRRSQQPN